MEWQEFRGPLDLLARRVSPEVKVHQGSQAFQVLLEIAGSPARQALQVCPAWLDWTAPLVLRE